MSGVLTAEPFLLKPSKSRRYPKIMVKNGKRSLLSSVFWVGRRNHGTCHNVLETAHRLRTDNANQHNKNTHAICTGLEVTRIQVWRRSKHIKTCQNEPAARDLPNFQGHPGTFRDCRMRDQRSASIFNGAARISTLSTSSWQFNTCQVDQGFR